MSLSLSDNALRRPLPRPRPGNLDRPVPAPGLGALSLAGWLASGCECGRMCCRQRRAAGPAARIVARLVRGARAAAFRDAESESESATDCNAASRPMNHGPAALPGQCRPTGTGMIKN